MTTPSSEYIKTARALNHTKRGRALLEYLIQHGEISTEGIREHLGEKHPPSAVRDLKDRGVIIKVVRRDGIGVYALDPDGQLREGLVGRQAFSKAFKDLLLRHYGPRCLLCGAEYEPRFLQPDHRVPQRVGGDEADAGRIVERYMPVCRSCNRSKSFECEHCTNWDAQDPAMCRQCFWASPEGYTHVAGRQERRVEVVWSGDDEIRQYDALRTASGRDGIASTIKRWLRDYAARR